MRILLTGANGFLGTYLKKALPGEVITLGRSKANKISCAIEIAIPTLPRVDMVIHNAGLAHRVPKSPEEEREFYLVNLFGTQNLLKALDSGIELPKAFIYISTVAIYGLEKGELIDENVEPIPQTPYAKSKYEAEMLLQAWAKQKQVNLTILRLPLVAGANGTPGNLGAMIRGIQRGYYRRIGKAEARKSMVLAEDVATLLPTLLDKSGVYNLTDGHHPKIGELEDYLADFFGKKIKTIPFWILKLATFLGDRIPGFPINSYRISKLGESLTFDDAKARTEISWNPRPVIGKLDLDILKK